MKETEIENILRRYPESKAYIELHSEPQVTAFISETPTHAGRQGSKTETKALQNSQPRTVVKITEIILGAATPAENDFIQYRYFRQLTMRSTAEWMKKSTSTIARFRSEFLKKAARIVN